MTSNVAAMGGGVLWVLFLSGNETNFDVGLKIFQAFAGLIGLSFAVYVVFLKRKWKRDAELAKEKEANKKLETENLVAALKAELEPQLQATAQKVISLVEQFSRVESIQNGLADTKSFHSLKYSVENDLSELQREIKSLQSSCSRRHEKLSSFGSIPDLKARVDELARKIDRLEDFRHKSADRYVLMVSYQQDIKLITEAISVLRGDLRAMIEMVDKL